MKLFCYDFDNYAMLLFTACKLESSKPNFYHKSQIKLNKNKEKIFWRDYCFKLAAMTRKDLTHRDAAVINISRSHASTHA